MKDRPDGHAGGLLICRMAIYLPSFPLLIVALPFPGALRHRADVQSALKGISAAIALCSGLD